MNVKEFLNQARVIDIRIRSRLGQLETLKSMAERTTAALTDLPGTKNVHHREDVMAELMDSEAEIQEDLSQLMKTRREVTNVIKRVPDLYQRTVLEERYLRLKPWERISKIIKYSLPQTYRIHEQALDVVRSILKDIED